MKKMFMKKFIVGSALAFSVVMLNSQVEGTQQDRRIVCPELLNRLCELQAKENRSLDIDYEWEIDQLSMITSQNFAHDALQNALQDRITAQNSLKNVEIPLCAAFRSRELDIVQYLPKEQNENPENVDENGETQYKVATTEVKEHLESTEIHH